MYEMDDLDGSHSKEPMPIGMALQRFIDSRPGMRERLTEAQLARLWREGNVAYIVEQTGRIALRRDVLRIEIFSPALRSNLNIQRDRLRDALNKRLGSRVISKLIFY